MKPFQERVVAERDELKCRLDKLNAMLMGGGIYDTLPKDEQVRLTLQSVCMTEYLRVLNERIAAFL